MGRLSKLGAAFLRLVAVAGPVLLGLLTALYIGRPSTYFLATGIALAVAILACDGWIIARRHWITGGFALTTQVAFSAAGAERAVESMSPGTWLMALGR